jgi:surface antigen
MTWFLVPFPPPSAQAQEAAPVTCPGLAGSLDEAFGDPSDCTLFRRTLIHALATAESGTVTRWTNTRSNVSGTIRLSAGESREGSVCRRAELTVTRIGATKRAAALACLRDGRWTFSD